MKKTSFIILSFLLMITLIFTFSFASEEKEKKDEENEEEQTEVVEENIEPERKETVINTFGKVVETNGIKEVTTGSVIDQVQEVVIEITQGDYIGEEFSTEYVLSYDLEGKMLIDELKVGDKVEVQITEDQDGNASATVTDVSRVTHIIWILAIFLVSIVLIGGKKGIRTVLGLIFAIAIIYFFMIKQLLNGTNAFLISIATSAIICLGTFAIIGGFNKKMFSASIGTFCGVLLSGLIAVAFTHFSKMTGAYDDAVRLSVNLSTVKFNFRDLLFAGMMISALGACMDVSMTIVNTLAVIKHSESEVTWKELFKEGMSAGKNNIVTMTNTLILAYLGCSLTLILLFMTSEMRLSEIVSKEAIAEQIMLAIIGSIGIIYTVPMTSFIYSFLNKDKVIYKRSTDNIVDGKRSLKL